jgi:hypothetical protein
MAKYRPRFQRSQYCESKKWHLQIFALVDILRYNMPLTIQHAAGWVELGVCRCLAAKVPEEGLTQLLGAKV